MLTSLASANLVKTPSNPCAELGGRSFPSVCGPASPQAEKGFRELRVSLLSVSQSSPPPRVLGSLSSRQAHVASINWTLPAAGCLVVRHHTQRRSLQVELCLQVRVVVVHVGLFALHPKPARSLPTTLRAFPAGARRLHPPLAPLRRRRCRRLRPPPRQLAPRWWSPGKR